MQTKKSPGTGCRVRDYMTQNPVTLDSSHSLLEAAVRLRSSGFRHLPIVVDGALVGMLSDRDVARLSPTLLLPHSAEEHHRVLRETTVGAVMTREPVSISPEAPLKDAVELLRRHRLGCLPVLEDGKLVGIITNRDMLGALLDQLVLGRRAA